MGAAQDSSIASRSVVFVPFQVCDPPSADARCRAQTMLYHLGCFATDPWSRSKPLSTGIRPQRYAVRLDDSSHSMPQCKDTCILSVSHAVRESSDEARASASARQLANALGKRESDDT